MQNKFTKKIIPYILMLSILFGLFLPTISRADENAYNECINGYALGKFKLPPGNGGITPVSMCLHYKNEAANVEVNPPSVKQDSDLYKNLQTCALINMAGCFEQIVYFLFNSIPSFLLGIIANILNVIIPITLGSALYQASFIQNAWTIVRDLSNMFFILILLYIAIQMILGIGHDVKKMVVNVLILALVINFSMFFTKVVIDTSNVIALVFYNKLNTNVNNTNGNSGDINHIPALNPTKGPQDNKDITGAMMSYFDPTKMLDKKFFEKIQKTTFSGSITGGIGTVVAGAALGSVIPVFGTIVGASIGAGLGIVGYFWSNMGGQVPITIMINIMIISGLIMYFAVYAFFIASLAFISRLAELWISIISSPFAFMSSSMHELENIPGVGWKEWSKRLVDVAFMAPIFMFFLYLIFMLIQSNIFGSLADRTSDQQGWIENMIMIIIPGILILTLLNKATSYAKKASGVLGEALIKGTEIAMGAVAGLSIGATAQILQLRLGSLGERMAKSTTLKDMETDPNSKVKRYFGTKLRDIGNFADNSSFDLRKGATGAVLSTLGSVSGLNLGTNGLGSKLFVKDSHADDRKKSIAKRQKRAKDLEVGEDEDIKQKLNQTEQELQEVTIKFANDLEKIEKDLEGAIAKRDALIANSNTDPENKEKRRLAREASEEVIKIRDKKNAITNGEYDEENQKYYTNNGQASEQSLKTAESEYTKTQQELLKLQEKNKKNEEDFDQSKEKITEEIRNLNDEQFTKEREIKGLDAQIKNLEATLREENFSSQSNPTKISSLNQQIEKLKEEQKGKKEQQRNIINKLTAKIEERTNKETTRQKERGKEKDEESEAEVKLQKRKEIKEKVETDLKSAKENQEVGESISSTKKRVTGLHHNIESINRRRKRNFANNERDSVYRMTEPLQIFSISGRNDIGRRFVREAHHKILMDAKIDDTGGGGGGGHTASAPKPKSQPKAQTNTDTHGGGGGGHH